jgi:NAD(P)-dependent dehydrogenase (short-subunit alcohol dehydrogenase family)
MPESLRDKEIVLAGGSGGLGQACIDLLAREGARLVVSYARRRERAQKWATVAKLVQACLEKPEDRGRLVGAAPNLYGLVVFAGDPARVSDESGVEDAMRRSHDVNYLGPVLLAREAAERMKAAGTPGSIVLFSTMQAIALFPGSTAYAAQKAALLHAARLLAKECRGPANIRVNAISPGVMAAGMAHASIASGKYDRFLVEGVIPRFGKAEDIARAVRFLLEPDNYITGQVLAVDGGITL